MSSQFQRFTKVLARSLKLDDQTLLSGLMLAGRDDIATVSDLRRRVFGRIIRPDDEIYLTWRYLTRDGYPSTLWMLKYQGKVIAALGIEPVELDIQGKSESAVRSMDAIVEPEYDSRGVGAWLTLAIQDRYDCVLVTGGNENSSSMLGKLFKSLPVRQHYKIILHSHDFLNQKIRFSPNWAISPLVDLFVNFYLKHKWRVNTILNTFEIRYFEGVVPLLEYIKEPVNALGQVKVVRTHSYLKWRYADNPCTEYLSLGVFDGDDLRAYAIYNLEPVAEREGVLMGQVIDWYIKSKDDAPDILTSLLIATIKQLKQRGADEVSMVLNDSFSAQAAIAAGFVFRHSDSGFFVHCANTLADDPVYSPQSWFQSLGDSDTA